MPSLASFAFSWIHLCRAWALWRVLVKMMPRELSGVLNCSWRISSSLLSLGFSERGSLARASRAVLFSATGCAGGWGLPL